MNPKIKTFDCVTESRKWKEAASARLNAMSADEELAYLHTLGNRVRAQLRERQVISGATLVLREDPPDYGTKKE
jgi:hypothetical protein